jgi:hypothetical protein
MKSGGMPGADQLEVPSPAIPMNLVEKNPRKRKTMTLLMLTFEVVDDEKRKS